MGFKASFLFVICLLILGYVLATVKENENKNEKEKEELKKGVNVRRKPEDVGSFTCDDQCLSWLHNNSRNDLTDESIVPRSGSPDITAGQFFKRHIPLVEEQRRMKFAKDWKECAAIWVVKGYLSGFTYAPKHEEGRKNIPWVDNEYTAAPPYTNAKENYLLARPEWWPSKEVAKSRNEDSLHAEWILHNQVATYHDLEAYTKAKSPINYVMMFSYYHPCRECAGLLVEILEKIKAKDTKANGKLLCYLAYREQYRPNDDWVNTNILKEGGITRIAKFPGV